MIFVHYCCELGVKWRNNGCY